MSEHLIYLPSLVPVSWAVSTAQPYRGSAESVPTD